jgi:hypothetical protein
MKITTKYRKDLEANYPVGAIAYGTVKDGQKIEVEITSIGGYNDRGYVSISFTSKKLEKSWRCDAETFKESFKITKMPKKKVEEQIPQSVINEMMPKIGEYLVSVCHSYPDFYKVVDVSKARVKVKSIARVITSCDDYNQSGMCVADTKNETPEDTNIWAKGYAGDGDGGVWVGHNPASPKNGIITCCWEVKKDECCNDNQPRLAIWKRNIFSLQKWDGKPIGWMSID